MLVLQFSSTTVLRSLISRDKLIFDHYQRMTGKKWRFSAASSNCNKTQESLIDRSLNVAVHTVKLSQIHSDLLLLRLRRDQHLCLCSVVLLNVSSLNKQLILRLHEQFSIRCVSSFLPSGLATRGQRVDSSMFKLCRKQPTKKCFLQWNLWSFMACWGRQDISSGCFLAVAGYRLKFYSTRTLVLPIPTLQYPV